MRVDLDLDSYLVTSNTNDVNNDLVTLTTDKVISNPQARKDFRNIDRLAETIEKEGQLQRIIVTPPNDMGAHTIIAGERRWRACKLLNITVDCVIKDTKNPHVIQLIENIEREDLTFMEEAEHLKVMQEYYKVSNSELADMVTRDGSYISRHLKIANSDSVFKSILKKAKVKSISAADDLEKIYSLKPKLAKRIVDNGLSREILTRTLKNLKKGKNTRVKKPEIKTLSPIIAILIDNIMVEVELTSNSSARDANGNIYDPLPLNELRVIGAK